MQNQSFLIIKFLKIFYGIIIDNLGLITNLPAEKITINKLNINVLITDITLKKIAVHFLLPLHFNFPFLLVQFPLQFSPFYHCDSNEDPVCSVLILIYLTPCSSFYFA